MITKGFPKATSLLRHTQKTRLPTRIVLQRTLTTPTKPLNATEVTIERDALLSPSARTLFCLQVVLIA